jgi:hypothetical protein
LNKFGIRSEFLVKEVSAEEPVYVILGTGCRSEAVLDAKRAPSARASYKSADQRDSF